jgi:hypothetical protein
MGLNNIEITDFIVGEWYKDNLVAPPVGHTTATDLQQPAINPLPAPPSAPLMTPPPKPAKSSLPAIPQNPASPEAIRYLGNNRRNIALLVNSPGTPFLQDNQLAFLTKILAACHLTIADVAIVNNAAAAITIAALRQQLQPKTILLFGLEPTSIRLPINFPVFKLQSYDDCMYLSAPALDQLVPDTEESKLLKSKLWVSLKTLFDV